MSAIKPLLLSMSLLAFAAGSAYAQDTKKPSDTQAKPSTSQSGSSSAGTSGSASGGASAKRDDKSAQYDFDKADKNKDGQLSRSEFNEMMKGSASAGGSTPGGGSTSAGQSSGSSAAKTQTPSSSTGKMDDKPKTSK
jgi:hypothetical protein